MLVVKVEIWPFGDKSAAYTISTIRIVNDGTTTEDDSGVQVANYDAVLHGSTVIADPPNYKVRVEGHKRHHGALSLLQKVLAKMLGAEPKQTQGHKL